MTLECKLTWLIKCNFPAISPELQDGCLRQTFGRLVKKSYPMVGKEQWMIQENPTISSRLFHIFLITCKPIKMCQFQSREQNHNIRNTGVQNHRESSKTHSQDRNPWTFFYFRVRIRGRIWKTCHSAICYWRRS